MKKLLGFACVVAIVAFAGFTLGDDKEKKADAKKSDEKSEIAWFDLHKCAICSCMKDHEQVMYDMKWETHLIDNGMISISHIPKKHRKAMDEAQKKMEGVIAKLGAGEQLDLCGFCVSMGDLMGAGAKNTDIKTSFGMVSLMTADDDETVKKIQAFAKQTQKEYKRVLKERPKKSPKKGKAKDKKAKDAAKASDK